MYENVRGPAGGFPAAVCKPVAVWRVASRVSLPDLILEGGGDNAAKTTRLVRLVRLLRLLRLVKLFKCAPDSSSRTHWPLLPRT
jgi:hypothetical protein